MKCLAAFIVAVAAEPCAVPASFPKTSTVSRRFFGLWATLDFSPQTFHETPGYCRKGPSWAHEPALNTNVGEAKGAPNNAYGDHLWFCFEEPRTLLGCLAECEARAFCGSIDRPNIQRPEECCLFWTGNSGDDAPNRECWVRKELPANELPADALKQTSVTVMPVPGITYLKLTSANTGVDAGAERNFCPIWTWCSFTVKDCFGNVIYDVVSEWSTDMDSDGNDMLGTSVVIYVVKSPDGQVLGRSSALSDGWEPVRFFNAQNQQVAVMVTASDWVKRLFFPLVWYINVDNPAASVAEEPMQDPRLLTFIATFQFRNLGYLATFPLFLLVLACIIAVCYYLILIRKGGRFQCECLIPMWLRNLLETYCGCLFSRRRGVYYDVYYDDTSTSCCGGRNKTTQWKTTIQPLTPAE